MKGDLPQKINKIECFIINLQNSNEEGNHWTAYYKNNDKKFYLDHTETLIVQKTC